jgi:NAD(P)-dependent dehydrogenase (short-subunit alcohol dehydrogenase family)
MRYLITGANRGIGFGLTQAFAKRGDDVFATARRPDDADELQALAKSHPNVVIVQLDVASKSSGKVLAEAVGDEPIDVVINNAGRFSHIGSVGSFKFNGFLNDFTVNTVGPMRVVDAVLPNLRAADLAVVCNITSNLGSLEQNETGDFYAYRASKAALNMVTRSLAADLRDDGIIAFVLHPGWVKTDMGGANAEITRDESVSGILNVLDNIGPDDSGSYRAWNGDTLPW